MNARRVEGTPRIRRAVTVEWHAELDLDAQMVTVFRKKDGRLVEIGRGRWVPLPPPLYNLRGRVVSDELDDDIRELLEHFLGRGMRTWSFDHGPWADAELRAIAAGVGEYEASLLHKLMWAFYADRWPLKFTEGCGFGAEGVAPLIAAALADPPRMRARWELLLLTGGLQWVPAEGSLDLESTDEDPWHDFYDEP